MKSKCTYFLWNFFSSNRKWLKKEKPIHSQVHRTKKKFSQPGSRNCLYTRKIQSDQKRSIKIYIFYLFKSEKVTNAKCLKNKILNPNCFSKIKMSAGQPITHMRRHLTNSHDPMSQTIPQRQNKVPSYNFILVSLRIRYTSQQRRKD